MEQRSDILIEMNEISPAVAAITNTNVYTVAENYFADLSSRFMRHPKITESENKLLAQPPSGYFEGLADAVLSRVKKENTIVNQTEQELLEIAPVLATITKANVYSVPKNYFINLNVTPLKVSPAKVLPLTFKKWTSIAAAAIVAGIIVIAALFFNNDNATGNNIPLNINKSVAEISDTEIKNYLDNTNENGDIALTAGYDLQPGDDANVEDFINSAPDTDIENYLKTNSEPGENPVKGI